MDVHFKKYSRAVYTVQSHIYTGEQHEVFYRNHKQATHTLIFISSLFILLVITVLVHLKEEQVFSSRKERTGVDVKSSLPCFQTSGLQKIAINAFSETQTYLNSRHMAGATNEQTKLKS